MVDWRDFICVHRDQLYRPAEAVDSCAVSEAGFSLDEYGLREHRDRVSGGVFDRADGLWAADRSHRDAQGSDDQRDLVFASVVADFAGEWICELCGISISAGTGGVGELAGGEQGGFRVVSES